MIVAVAVGKAMPRHVVEDGVGGVAMQVDVKVGILMHDEQPLETGAGGAQTFGVVVAGARPVRSKKSTSNGSVKVAAYMSQSCKSRPRPKRSMTSLICWRSHNARTISSVAGYFAEAAITPFPQFTWRRVPELMRASR